jgi:hypothetical protein
MIDHVTLWVIGLSMAYIGGHVVSAALSAPTFWLFCLPVGAVIVAAWRLSCR